MGLSKWLGLDAISDGFKKVGDIVDKTVEDKDKRNELNVELAKLQAETEVKIQTIINGRMGTMLEKCISIVFPMIAFIFGLSILSNLLMFWINFWTKSDNPFLYIDDRLFQIIMVYIGGFFGSSAVGKYANRNTGGK